AAPPAMSSLLHLVRTCLPAAALLAASACATAVVGDGERGYGEVTLSVAGFDQLGVERSRDIRTAPGAELVEPLDRELIEPITIDGDEESDPSGLFAAREARIGEVQLTRAGDLYLRARGESLLAVRSAERNGAALSVAVDSGWFEIALAGELSAASTDRILGTALVRIVRGEALLADDCRPDCLYDSGPDTWLCAPVRELVESELGACAGPLSPEERSAMDEAVAAGKHETCDGHGLVPRPLCEWAFEQALITGACCAGT
ncbi:MAG TPA: hypothetical protein VFU21_17390, partial [Kofleriaceae bacterium]|nr:hypothetical protein [Kofleriaceae bacterium]